MSDPDRWAYDDLQVRIDRDSDGGYRTVATAPDGRTARGVFQIPVTDAELDDFVQRVGLVRRRGGPPEERLDAIKELGSSLFDALFAGQVGTVYTAARAAASDGRRRMRITLRLSGAPELMRLPWEFLYLRPRFIAQSTDTPVVRTLDIASGRRAQKVALPLRILGVISSPSGYLQLDAESERRNLETALEPLSREGLVELSWLERATLSDLEDRVADGDDIHVIHYIGHGAYDEATETGVLVLETPEGRADDVAGERIGAVLQDESSLRLVVLNSCDGARTSHVDPFSGVATSLIEFDIPAVVGMQFEITDDAAIAFSARLYKGLAQGMPIDAAIGPARRAIMAQTEAEFATPVLFLRDGEARLFDIDSTTGTPARAVAPRAGGEPVDAVPTGAEAREVDVAVVPAHVDARNEVSQAIVPGPVGEGAGPSDPESPGSTRRRRIARALWRTAYVLAAAGIIVTLVGLLTGETAVLPFFWLAALILAAVVAAFAVGMAGHRRKGVGILMTLGSLLPVTLLFLDVESPWVLAIAISALQFGLVWTARSVTKNPTETQSVWRAGR